MLALLEHGGTLTGHERDDIVVRRFVDNAWRSADAETLTTPSEGQW
jgi:hypothetical protein